MLACSPIATSRLLSRRASDVPSYSDMPAHATPQLFIAYAPQGPGLRCALLYFAAGEDLWGWLTGPQGELLVSDYFHVAGFHSLREPSYRAVDIAGLHSGWAPDPAMRAELARVQDQFAREWLVYRCAKEARAHLPRHVEAGLGTRGRKPRLPRAGTLNPPRP